MSEEIEGKCLGAGGARKSRMNLIEAAGSSKAKADLSKFKDRFKQLHQRRVCFLINKLLELF